MKVSLIVIWALGARVPKGTVTTLLPPTSVTDVKVIGAPLLLVTLVASRPRAKVKVPKASEPLTVLLVFLTVSLMVEEARSLSLSVLLRSSAVSPLGQVTATGAAAPPPVISIIMDAMAAQDRREKAFILLLVSIDTCSS